MNSNARSHYNNPCWPGSQHCFTGRSMRGQTSVPRVVDAYMRRNNALGRADDRGAMPACGAWRRCALGRVILGRRLREALRWLGPLSLLLAAASSSLAWRYAMDIRRLSPWQRGASARDTRARLIRRSCAAPVFSATRGPKRQLWPRQFNPRVSLAFLLSPPPPSLCLVSSRSPRHRDAASLAEQPSHYSVRRHLSLALIAAAGQ